MARIVLTTTGSLGDLHPMFPIAQELGRRGHAVKFVVPEWLHGSVVGEGFQSHPVLLPKQPITYDPNHTAARDVRGQVRAKYGPFLKRCIEVLDEASAHADVILSTPHQVATAVVGTGRNIPWVTLTVFPGLIPSAYSVPEPHWLPALPTAAGRAVNRLTWKVYRYGLRYLASETIDEVVSAHGLPADRDLMGPGDVSPYLCLVLSSRFYSPPQPDWPPHYRVTGYTEFDRPRGWREPAELARFIDAGPPPVVVSASSARNSAALMVMAKDALVALGHRGILLTGQASDELLGKADHVILDDNVAAWRYIPLSYILPRALLVVHHAGIGTSIATINRGLPAVAIPVMFDHWYNASRVRALGVAKVISGAQEMRNGEIRYKHLNEKVLAAAIHEVATVDSYRSRAKELAQRMRNEDGARTASDAVEELLAGVSASGVDPDRAAPSNP